MRTQYGVPRRLSHPPERHFRLSHCGKGARTTPHSATLSSGTPPQQRPGPIRILVHSCHPPVISVNHPIHPGSALQGASAPSPPTLIFIHLPFQLPSSPFSASLSPPGSSILPLRPSHTLSHTADDPIHPPQLFLPILPFPSLDETTLNGTIRIIYAGRHCEL